MLTTSIKCNHDHDSLSTITIKEEKIDFCAKKYNLKFQKTKQLKSNKMSNAKVESSERQQQQQQQQQQSSFKFRLKNNARKTF